MKIVDVDSFMVEVPLTDDQVGKRMYNNTGVTRVRTDAGITGYGFSDRPIDLDRARPILMGADPFTIERHLADGLADGLEANEDTAFEILKYAREHLAPFLRVRRIEFFELPKTISGKIRRVELRAREDAAVGPLETEWRDDQFPALKR